eukprot:04330.XXX_134142_132652_1 [CDS] Oithona nana genome sequencing.
MEKFLGYFVTLILISIVLAGSIEEDVEAETKKGKILNFFTVVRFPNSVCAGDTLNGTCYSAEECSSRGGVQSGTCAGGYGVCCTFQRGCGAEASENCTYFQSSGTETGQCRLKICPCSDNICQLRLDFQTFVINQPKITAESVQKINTQMFYDKLQCQTDQFSVTAPGNPAPPVICGTNSGEHMYVDASDMCNDLAFNLADTGSTVTRTWTIKITQYDCNYDNLAPDGCTQYFWGATNDIVKTYNFDGGAHLASQNQNICVRRERNTCRICWSTVDAQGDFELSTITTEDAASIAGTAKHEFGCCNYGTNFAQMTGYDCAKIPSPSKATDSAELTAVVNGFCGGDLGTAGTAVEATVCSKAIPFHVRFLSDLYESAAENTVTPNGFRLAYILTGC